MPPRPTPADRHYDKVLSNVGLAFFQSKEKYIAGRVFPSIPVSKQTDAIRVYSVADLLRIEAEEMGEGTAAPQETGTFSHITYGCKKYGKGDYLTPADLANDDGPIPPDQILIEQLTQANMTKMERTWAAANMATSKWDHDCQGQAAGPTGKQFLQWDKANSDPIQDVLDKKDLIHDSTGFDANVGVIARDAFNKAINHSVIRGRFDYTSSASITAEMLAKLWGLEELIVASAIYNAGPAGTPSFTKIFTNNMLLAHRAKTPSVRVPSAGYTFLWTAPTGAPQGTKVMVRRIPRPELGNRTDYESIMYWDQKVTSSALGAYMYDVYSNL